MDVLETSVCLAIFILFLICLYLYDKKKPAQSFIAKSQRDRTFVITIFLILVFAYSILKRI